MCLASAQGQGRNRDALHALEAIRGTRQQLFMSDAEFNEYPQSGNIIVVDGLGVTRVPEPRFAG